MAALDLRGFLYKWQVIHASCRWAGVVGLLYLQWSLKRRPENRAKYRARDRQTPSLPRESCSLGQLIFSGHLVTVESSVFSGTCHSIFFLCHLPAPNNIQQYAEAGLEVPLLLLSLGPLLAPGGHTSTSLVNAGVDGRYQLKSVTLWPGAIWTRAVELRVREGLG